jgi:outer membrane protein assembly factor BamB
MVRSKNLILSAIFVLILVVLNCSFFDFVPPEINIISPVDGERCYGEVILRAEVKDKYFDKTELYINGNKQLEYKESDIFDSLPLSEGTNYTIKLKAFDKRGNWKEEEVSGVELIVGSLPNTPSTPSGPTSGYVDSTYSFSASTTDPDGDNVAYQFDWGDENLSSWSNYVSSGSSVSMGHSYSSEGIYSVKAKAKDEDGMESGWSNGHSITISSISSGSQKWAFSTGNNVRSSPAIGSDGTIYVGSHDDNFYAINPDGSQKWAFSTGDNVHSSPAIGSDGTIYVGSYDGKLYAINPDGSQKWTFLSGAQVFSSPAIGSDGTIYVGSHDNNLYAINPDGSQKWVFSTGYDVLSSPAVGSDGTIYVGSDDNNLYAINPDGSQKWAFSTGDNVHSSPAIGSDGTIYVGSYDGKLYAINPYGTQKWAFSIGSGVYSCPAIGSDGTIYVGSWDENLYAINPDGTQKWAFSTTSDVYSSPAIGSDGTIYIYVAFWDKNLYAINPDGSQKWASSIGNGVYSCPAIGSDGTIYVGSDDGNLYAIYGSSGGLADTPWPMFHHDLKHSGREEEP